MEDRKRYGVLSAATALRTRRRHPCVTVRNPQISPPRSRRKVSNSPAPTQRRVSMHLSSSSVRQSSFRASDHHESCDLALPARTDLRVFRSACDSGLSAENWLRTICTRYSGSADETNVASRKIRSWKAAKLPELSCGYVSPPVPHGPFTNFFFRAPGRRHPGAENASSDLANTATILLCLRARRAKCLTRQNLKADTGTELH